MTRAVAHALVVPMPVDRLRTWCGADPAEVADDAVATEPRAVTCDGCIDAMKHATEQLRAWTPKLRTPGPRTIDVEAVAIMLPGVSRSDDALEVLAHARERIREGDRSARRVKVLEERLSRIEAITRGRA